MFEICRVAEPLYKVVMGKPGAQPLARTEAQSAHICMQCTLTINKQRYSLVPPTYSIEKQNSPQLPLAAYIQYPHPTNMASTLSLAPLTLDGDLAGTNPSLGSCFPYNATAYYNQDFIAVTHDAYEERLQKLGKFSSAFLPTIANDGPSLALVQRLEPSDQFTPVSVCTLGFRSDNPNITR